MEELHIANAQYQGSRAELYPAININSRIERYENLDNRNQQTINTIGNEVVGGNQSAWRAALSLSGQYDISHWYKKRYEAQYYEKLRDSNVHNCETTAKKMIRDVTEIFGAMAEGKIKLKYSVDILHRLHDITKLKEQAMALGQFSYEDALKAQSDAVNMEKEISKIRKEIKECSVRLGNYTGKSYTDDMEVTQLSPHGQLSITDEIKVILATPEYQTRLRELEAARSKERSAANNFLPDISLYARYDLYNANTKSMETTFNDVRQVGYSAGILISLPLFDGGIRKWERQRNIHEVRRQEENVWVTFAEKNKDIKTLQAGYDELNKSYHHYQKLNEQYEKIMTIGRKANLLGERSNLDLMDLEKNALAVECDFQVLRNSLSIYEKQLALEINYKQFMSEHYGDWSCKY
jgi:outer membrane protein TolC